MRHCAASPVSALRELTGSHCWPVGGQRPRSTRMGCGSCPVSATSMRSALMPRPTGVRSPCLRARGAVVRAWCGRTRFSGRTARVYAGGRARGAMSARYGGHAATHEVRTRPRERGRQRAARDGEINRHLAHWTRGPRVAGDYARAMVRDWTCRPRPGVAARQHLCLRPIPPGGSYPLSDPESGSAEFLCYSRVMRGVLEKR